jgi:hypothetical protein
MALCATAHEPRGELGRTAPRRAFAATKSLTLPPRAMRPPQLSQNQPEAVTATKTRR